MRNKFKITYDKEADAMYIYLKEGKIEHTKEVSNLVFVDVDKKDEPVGIEILNASFRIGKDTKMNSIPIEILSGSKVFA